MFNSVNNGQLFHLMQAILGPCPLQPFMHGRFFKQHFTPAQQAQAMHLQQMEHLGNENQLIRITNIAKLLHSKDADFVSFVHGLLEYDPSQTRDTTQPARDAECENDSMNALVYAFFAALCVH